MCSSTFSAAPTLTTRSFIPNKRPISLSIGCAMPALRSGRLRGALPKSPLSQLPHSDVASFANGATPKDPAL
jgi:hypothetical protein